MPDKRDTGYSVGEAARLAGVTVRTLHHYGEIGLLVPAGRSAAGYRQYSDSDLDRLARILYYRELDFSLEDIATMLGDGASVCEHLARQHKLLSERLRRTQAMVASIEREMEATMTGNDLTPEEKLEIFGADYDPSWEAEAEQRWGNTEAWKQSRRRTARFSQDDWRAVKASGDAFDAELVAAFRSGAAPDSAVAMDLAEKHRGMIGQFYDCSYAMHRGLAEMYLADERFTANYERLAPGLAQWVHDAIQANADRHPDEQGVGWG
jgi:DNA-binding transcriptional MerR regulator